MSVGSRLGMVLLRRRRRRRTLSVRDRLRLFHVEGVWDLFKAYSRFDILQRE